MSRVFCTIYSNLTQVFSLTSVFSKETGDGDISEDELFIPLQFSSHLALRSQILKVTTAKTMSYFY